MINRKEIIFGATKEKALFKLEMIKEEIMQSNSNEYIEKRGKDRIITNLREIIAVSTIDSARGHKCTRAYIDKDITIRSHQEIVLPCCMYCTRDDLVYF